MILTDDKLPIIECDDVSLFEGLSIIKKLELELNNSKGVGLAAVQIGINAKVAIIRAGKNVDLINPEIISSSDLAEFNNEGCLSFPNEWLTTSRYSEVFVKDLLHPSGIVFTGAIAVVVQHEIGHMYGETMHDYVISRPGVNEKCWCGSGKKYKKCHKGEVING